MVSVVNRRPGLDYVGVCVVFICHDGRGSFVMARRGAAARDERGRWDIGGGAVELGQTVEAALDAEVRQEYGASCAEKRFLSFRDVIRPGEDGSTHWLALDFAVLVDRAQVRNNEPHKLDEVGWFTLSRLPAPLHSALPAFLARYREPLAGVGIVQASEPATTPAAGTGPRTPETAG